MGLPLSPKQKQSKQQTKRKIKYENDKYRVEVGVVRELKHFRNKMAVSGVEAGLASSPKGLKDVLHRFFGVGIHQQRQVAPNCVLHARSLLSSAAEIDDDGLWFER